MAIAPLPPRLLDRLAKGENREALTVCRRAGSDVAAVWAIQVADEVPRRARVDAAEGRRLADVALILARRSANPLVLARALRADGHRLALQNRYRAALARYERAVALFARHRDPVQVAVTYSGSLQTLIYLGRYDRALRHATAARAIFRRSGDRVRLARLDSNVGNIHFRRDQFDRALACYRRAEAALRALGEHGDAAIALRNIAVCLTSLNRFDESLATYQEARRHCLAHDVRQLVAEVDYNVAYLHFLCGDYERALRAYAEARAQADATGDRYHRALCDLDEAEVCLELNDDSGARERAAAAADGFAALGMRYERAKALTFLGTAHARLGDMPTALATYRRARSFFAADGNRAWVAIVDVSRATALCRADRWLEAARALPRPTAPLSPVTAVFRDLLAARVALRRGRRTRARHAVTRAARRLRTLHAPTLEWHVHVAEGEVREAAGDTAGATLAYRRARRAVDGLRARVSGDELKVSFLANKLAIYERLVRLSMCASEAHTTDGSRAETVFGLVEDAKSRSLADLLAFRASTLESRSPAPAPAKTVRMLRQEMRAFERRMDREALSDRPDPARLRRMRRAIGGHQRRLSRALGALWAEDAALAELQHGDAASLQAVQLALQPDTSLLEYYIADGELLGLTLTADRLHVTSLGSMERVERALRLLRFQLAKFQLGPDYVRTFSRILASATHRHLQELHDCLIAPLAPRLTTARLVVVPHGSLHYLPFHALFDGTQYLIDRFALSFAPSATVYRLCQSAPASPHGGSVVLATADGHAPHIQREAEEVGSVLPGARVFMGPDATVDRLRTEGRSARFVHIATHGFFRRDNPMLSSVRLSGGDVTLADLFALTLEADLVTLSGCGTGLSAVVGGDELIGLMRGLLYAGARSVLLTMWQVDDFSTAEFMCRFYRLLIGGLDGPTAFQAAMRDVRERFPHPYHWAPFVLVGQTPAPYISASPSVPIDSKGIRRPS